MTKFKKCDVKKCSFDANVQLRYKCSDCQDKAKINLCNICLDYYELRIVDKMESWVAGQGNGHTVIANFFAGDLDLLEKFWTDVGIWDRNLGGNWFMGAKVKT